MACAVIVSLLGYLSSLITRDGPTPKLLHHKHPGSGEKYFLDCLYKVCRIIPVPID